MVEQTWRLMRKQGIERDKPETWQQVATYFDIRGVQKLRDLRNEPTGPDDYPAIRSALDGIFARRPRTSAEHWGQALVTLRSDRADWLLPNTVWHFDHPYDAPGEILGVNVFLLMDDVDAQGGGTVVLSGSPGVMAAYLQTKPVHRTLKDQNKKFLRFDPWLNGLKVPQHERSEARNRHYMDGDTLIHGVPARIVELTGEAGDVFITHPALLHAPAMNVRPRPRMMRTSRVHARLETSALPAA